MIAPEAAELVGSRARAAVQDFGTRLSAALVSAGYPRASAPLHGRVWLVLAALVVLVANAALCYGPVAAWLTELFPPRIRYTAVSIAYHVGAGWFGGFLPVIGFAIVALTGNIYSGLWYPIVMAVVSATSGALFLPETYREESG